MSPASHMVGRLRKVYGIVWNRMRFLNERSMRPPLGRRETAPHCMVEQLEPRLMLSIATAGALPQGALGLVSGFFSQVDIAANTADLTKIGPPLTLGKGAASVPTKVDGNLRQTAQSVNVTPPPAGGINDGLALVTGDERIQTYIHVAGLPGSLVDDVESLGIAVDTYNVAGSGTVIASMASVVYTSMSTPSYEYTTPGTYLGWDDYDTTLSDLPGNQDVSLTSMRWVGGLASAGTASFNFYDYSTSAWVAGFSVSLGSGYYIYTFTPPANFVIPDHGVLEVTATSAGKWRFTPTAPTTGANNPNEGYAPAGYYHRFELTGNQNSPPPDDHGNDAAHATPVAVNSTTSGNIEVAGDQDWFSFQATADKLYVLETVAGGTLSDTTLTLYGQNGTSQIAFDDDGGAGSLSKIEWTAPSGGTYYAAVRGYQTNTGTYNLQISEAVIIPGEIHGSKWNDLDRDGAWDAGELGLGNWKIYLDLDDSGDWTAGEPYQMTAPDGSYSFVGLTPGTYRVAEELQPGWERSYPGEFHIDVDFVGTGLTPSQKEVFKQAADRWAQVIVGDIPDVMTSLGLIDDVIIEASGVPIDGPGGILGQAGPTEVRTGSYLPACGIMEFDSADLAALEASGQLDEVIIHEMGHVLGFGVIWNYLGLISGAGGADPRFLGAGATAQYEAIFGVSEGSVPVENTGGSGTRDSHWRESVLDNELMTGWINAGLNPLSSITVASFADMGYDVNLGAADPFLPALLANRAASGGAYTTGLIPVLGTEPKILPAAPTKLGMAAMSAGGLTGTYTVVLDNGEIVTDIDFGNTQNHHVFYNNSYYDGYDPAPTPDDAIAADKEALLPGQTATPANCTGYSRGINGIMVDIADLPDPGGSKLTDIGNYFTFKAGPGGNPADWLAGPSPSDNLVRALTGGVYRIHIVWLDPVTPVPDPNEAVQNQWLEVTVLATDQTGLAAPHVFYFGNLRGDMNNDQLVDMGDYAIWFNNYGESGPDGDLTMNNLVDMDDYAEWFNNYGNILPPITWGGGGAGGVISGGASDGLFLTTDASAAAAPTAKHDANALPAPDITESTPPLRLVAGPQSILAAPSLSTMIADSVAAPTASVARRRCAMTTPSLSTQPTGLETKALAGLDTLDVLDAVSRLA